MDELTSNGKSVLLLADTNDRASIAILRSLKGSVVTTYIALSKKDLLNYLKYSHYWKNKVFVYNPDNEDLFISSLISIRDVVGPFVLFPCGEKLLRWAIKNKTKLAENEISIPTVNIGTYIKFSNKKTFIIQCEKFGLSIPQEFEFANSNLPDKFVVKPKVLDDSEETIKSPVLIENKKSLNRLIQQKIKPENHFIQEYIEGPSIYYCGCYKDGTKLNSFVQLNLHQQPNGKSVIKAVPYELPDDVILKIDEMMKDSMWNGVMMIELKHSLKSGKYYAIELNPRFWGPLQLSIDNGVDFPKILLGISSETVKPSMQYGYRWLTGYLCGIPIKLETNTDFQIHRLNLKNDVRYRDIWMRSDSYIFFIVESFFCFILSISKLLKGN